MLKFSMVAAAVVTLMGCGGAAGNLKTGEGTPTVAALIALEKQAMEAYIRGDGKFFEGYLSDKIVVTEGGRRVGKAELLERIGGSKCSFQEGWALSEAHLSKINDDTYVVSYLTAIDGTCTWKGKTEKEPSPVRVSTVLVRSGETWQAVFHGENVIVAPQALTASVATHDEHKKEAADEAGVAMLTVETSLWEAWKAKDGKRIEELTAKELAFVNIFGTYLANKAEAMKDWTGALCEIESISLKDSVGTLVSPTVGILTLTGTVEGSCGGQKPPPVYGTTVYVKEGDRWKWAFGFNSPD